MLFAAAGGSSIPACAGTRVLWAFSGAAWGLQWMTTRGARLNMLDLTLPSQRSLPLQLPKASVGRRRRSSASSVEDLTVVRVLAASASDAVSALLPLPPVAPPPVAVEVVCLSDTDSDDDRCRSRDDTRHEPIEPAVATSAAVSGGLPSSEHATSKPAAYVDLISPPPLLRIEPPTTPDTSVKTAEPRHSEQDCEEVEVIYVDEEEDDAGPRKGMHDNEDDDESEDEGMMGRGVMDAQLLAEMMEGTEDVGWSQGTESTTVDGGAMVGAGVGDVYESLKANDLRALLRGRGLVCSGRRKEDMITALRSADRSQSMAGFPEQSTDRFSETRGRVVRSELPRGPNGFALCRLCKTECPSARRTFCSQACVHEHMLRTSASYVRQCLMVRDKGVCAICNTDTHALYQAARRACTQWSMSMEAMQARVDTVVRGTRLEGKVRLRAGGRSRGRRLIKRGLFWHADHIVAVAEGGGLRGLDNFRTLCVACHHDVTRQLRARLGQKGKKGSKKTVQDEIGADAAAETV